MSQLTVMTIVLCLVAWFAIGIVVSLVFGRIVRARDRQRPPSGDLSVARTAWERERSALPRTGTG
jgi:hypothetical protein